MRQVCHQVSQLSGAGIHLWHERSVRLDPFNPVFSQRMKASLQILQMQIEIAPASDKPAKGLAVAQVDLHQFIACRDARTRSQQRFSNLSNRQPASDIGEVRADGFSAAANHVTSRTTPLAEEESFPGARVARDTALRSRSIQ